MASIGNLLGLAVRGCVMSLFLALCALPATAASYVSFDPAGSIATGARSINDRGYVTGGFEITGGDRTCYVRYSATSLVTFTDKANDTQCGGQSINDKGEIAGLVGSVASPCPTADAPYQYHGFVRPSNGMVAPFDAPDSVSTEALGINLSDQIAGFYFDKHCVYHGFLRVPEGRPVFTLINVEDAGKGKYQGTLAQGINNGGEITGYFLDNNSDQIGFYTTPKGAGKQCGKGCAHPFQVPGSFHSDRGSGKAINSSGEITGEYVDSMGVYHGFLRDSQGKITAPLDAPNAGTTTGQGTFPMSINDDGDIAGQYIDSLGHHGFLVFSQNYSDFTQFDAPNSSNHTIPYGINAKDHVTGIYWDTNNQQHGFIRSP